jgi:hypothetical protein
MKYDRWKTPTLSILLWGGILLFCQLLSLNGKAQDKADYKGAGKILIPHKSWPCGMAEGIPVPERGALVFEADMKLDQVYDMGKTPYGHREVFIVQGGTVSGEKLQGSVMPGGLDFQLSLSNGSMEIEQIFVLRTNDGKYIYLRSAGTAADKSDVRMVPDFEAPNGSTCSWLSTGKYAGRRVLDLAAKTMKISIYDVADVSTVPDSTNSVRVAKPADVQDQSWDFRKAAAGEKKGEVVVRENGGSDQEKQPEYHSYYRRNCYGENHRKGACRRRGLSEPGESDDD